MPANFSDILKPQYFHKFFNCSLQEFRFWTDLFNFNIIDTLKVPDAPGDYVLSFRWDSE